MNKQDLLDLKEKIEASEKKLAQDEGALRQLRQQLKDEGFEDIEEAEEYIKTLDEEIEDLQNKLDTKLEKIQEML